MLKRPSAIIINTNMALRPFSRFYSSINFIFLYCLLLELSHHLPKRNKKPHISTS